MSQFNDDSDVRGLLGDESAAQAQQDAVTFAAARDVIRASLPAEPPAPTPELATLLRHGLPRRGSRARTLIGRFAGLGVGAKVLLVAGVAAASGAAATGALALRHTERPPSSVVRDHPAVAPASTTPSAQHDPAAAGPPASAGSRPAHHFPAPGAPTGVPAVTGPRNDSTEQGVADGHAADGPGDGSGEQDGHESSDPSATPPSDGQDENGQGGDGQGDGSGDANSTPAGSGNSSGTGGDDTGGGNDTGG